MKIYYKPLLQRSVIYEKNSDKESNKWLGKY